MYASSMLSPTDHPADGRTRSTLFPASTAASKTACDGDEGGDSSVPVVTVQPAAAPLW